jgi:flagellar protein FliJ
MIDLGIMPIALGGVPMRDGRDANLLRRKQFEVSEKERRVALLGTMIRDFDNMIAELNGQIAVEEDRTKIKDTGHPAYSTFAIAAAKRRQNLFTSMAHTKSLLDAAKREFDETLGDLQSIPNNQLPPAPASYTPEAISTAR